MTAINITKKQDIPHKVFEDCKTNTIHANAPKLEAIQHKPKGIHNGK